MYALCISATAMYTEPDVSDWGATQYADWDATHRLEVTVCVSLVWGSTNSDLARTVCTTCWHHFCPLRVVVWALTHPSPPIVQQ